jgi:energy-coupling factor transport system substrate-specific component
VSAKFVALLGVLVSINAVLRFAETGIPGPGGFSPIFFLIILTGYVFGGGFGFLMGALTLLVSAIVTGGMGPWLPGQMLAAGWVGLSSPLVRPLARLLDVEGQRGEALLLTVFAAAWGFAFGFIMNLWFWPFLSGPANQYWAPGISMSSTLQRYFAFYLTTSLVWDIIRAAGNVILTLAFGAPTLRALRRFQLRFVYRYQPSPDSAVSPGGGS